MSKPARALYIFDLDGTLATLTPARKNILLDVNDPHRWDRFYDACVTDEPNPAVIKVMHDLRFISSDIWIWSGRSDRVRLQTVAWLEEHTHMCAWEIEHALRMRQHGDNTVDHVLKASWYHNQTLVEDQRRLVATFDDRDQVVAMWRANGITCFQVAPGDF